MARKKQVEEKANLDGWITSYGDIMSLLLVFFIILFAMANTDLKNFMAVAASLRAAFHGVGENPAAAVIGDDKSVTSQGSMAAAPLFFDSLPPRQRDFVRITTELTVLANEVGLDGEIDVNMSLEGVIISMSDAMAFEPGSADLRPEAKEVLLTVSDLLKDSDNKLRVEGNTDDLPTNSPLYPTNWELSVARAVSIVRYLADEGGIDPSRLSASGNAEFNPMVPNDSRANRSINRRADIVIVYPTGERKFSVSLPPIEGITDEPPDSSGILPTVP